MKMEKLRNILFFLVFILGLSLFLPRNVMAQTAGKANIFSDTQGHWAENSINTWVERGYIRGYPEGKFKPDKSMTRAEFCTLINRIFGYNRRMGFLSFADVPEGKWFTKEIHKAVTAGYLSSYPGGKIRPNEEITRQAVAVILTKILSLKAAPKDLYSKFEDLGRLTLGEAMAINSVLNKNYMRGYTNNLFRPHKGITRAEILTILDRVVGTLYDYPDVYGTPYDKLVLNGNVTINTSNVTLRNVSITGDLHLTEGIGDGHVTLVNVTVKGVTKVSGGAIINNCDLGSLVVATANKNKIRLLAQGATKIDFADVRAAAKLEETNLVGTGFNDVVFNVSQGAKVELKGTFKKVDLEGADIELDFSRGTIENLNLLLAARNAKINLASNAHLKNLKVVNRADIKGWGTIDTADVYANGVTFESVPRTLKVASGVSATVRGKTVWGTQTSDSSSTRRLVPLFVDDYPRITNIRSSGFDLLLKADEDCKAYYVVLSRGERVPAAEQVMAGEDATDRLVTSNRRGWTNLTAFRQKRITIEDLGQDVQYNVFIVLESKGVNVEPAVTKLKVTTARTD